ncbi:cytochrome P450 [Nannocystis bainbridge]|uniref:Cytochrome P450 n=1 Tax=Nannocystis bainbridge TaxID=2995303 RepID=A0ABT5E4R2_9BACT|nr:cytochrome P450 [Nannocystis bainbridge]MDC0720324.1 cytochrome P450 [Nannocystis bainbridge]
MSHQPTAPPVKFDILSPAFFADPYPTLARMREEEPVFWHPLLKSWVLTRYADVQRVLRDSKSEFSNSKVEQYGVGAPESVRDKLEVFNTFVSSWVAFMDPPNHTRLRALISRAFTVQAVERLRPRIQHAIDELLAAVRPRGRMDVVADFAAQLPMIVFSELMGIPREDGERLREDALIVMSLFGAGIATAEAVESAYRGVMSYYEYFNAHIAARRSRSTEDLLSKLVEARVDGVGMTDTELVAMCVTLFLASQETTLYMVANAVNILVRRPEQAQRLRQEPRLLDNALEELMRFDGPTFGTFRRALVDITDLPGGRIPAGDYVLSVLCSANRDGHRFPDPDRFDIERQDVRHLSFSSGIHTCPGAALSRLEGRLAIQTLLRTFSDLRLASDAPLEWLPSMMVRGFKSLPITMTSA